MPAKSDYPKLRTHRKRGDNGQLWVSYWFDMRGTGKPDIPLGTDFADALSKWERLRRGETIESPRPIRLKPLTPGKRRKLPEGAWAGLPNWAQPMYLGAERRTAEDGRAVFLTIREFADIVRRANGRCEVTGLPFSEVCAPRDPFSPSIDRIDSERGYVAGNVRIVCLIANLAMNTWGEAPLRRVAEALCGSGQSANAGAFPQRASA